MFNGVKLLVEWCAYGVWWFITPVRVVCRFLGSGSRVMKYRCFVMIFGIPVAVYDRVIPSLERPPPRLDLLRKSSV